MEGDPGIWTLAQNAFVSVNCAWGGGGGGGELCGVNNDFSFKWFTDEDIHLTTDSPHPI